MTDNIEATILAHEARRRDAMLAGDVEGLDRLLYTRAIWIHGSGLIDDRSSFLNGFRDGRLKCLKLELSEQEVLALDGGGLCAGIVRMEAEVSGERRTTRSRYVAVWAWSGGDLRLVSHQSTRLPEN